MWGFDSTKDQIEQAAFTSLETKQKMIKVLIADDHDLLRNGLKSYFDTQDDMRVVAEAVNGQQAIEMAQQHSPDVILMDLRMPQMGGVEAIRQIRSAMPQIAIVALTSYDDPDMVETAIQAGAISYLIKNVSTTELGAAVRAAYEGKSQLSREAMQALVRASRRPNLMDYQLTNREVEVLRCLTRGSTNAEIADELTISHSTVKKHVRNILAKLGTSNRTEAATLAIQNKIV